MSLYAFDANLMNALIRQSPSDSDSNYSNSLIHVTINYLVLPQGFFDLFKSANCANSPNKRKMH